MFIAQQKRKQNIAEYLLYMWNVEDLIRANSLDMSKVKANVIAKYGISDAETMAQVVDWWENLVEMMRREKKEVKGHLTVLTVLCNDVYNYHLYLLTQNSEIPYQNAFRTAWSDLNVFMEKIPGGDKMQHVELALTAVYDYYLLKLQQKTVLADTKNAILRISHFLALLSQKYLEAERNLHPDADISPDGMLKGSIEE